MQNTLKMYCSLKALRAGPAVRRLRKLARGRTDGAVFWWYA
jgi:hypothetical protein